MLNLQDRMLFLYYLVTLRIRNVNTESFLVCSEQFTEQVIDFVALIFLSLIRIIASIFLCVTRAKFNNHKRCIEQPLLDVIFFYDVGHLIIVPRKFDLFWKNRILNSSFWPSRKMA